MGAPPLTVAAAAMVLFEVLSLAKGAISQYPGYSVARSNVDTLTGNSCALANDVLLETNPNASLLTPIGATRPPLSMPGEGTGSRRAVSRSI